MSRTIADIYEDCRIPPWLAEHMYRVAAVSALLFDALKEKNPSLEGRHDLILANLLHDAGNIIKFDLDRFPAPDGRTDYWKAVQKDMREKYGSDEISATAAIAEELGVRSAIAPILKNTSDQDALVLEASGTALQKIACYADQRVSPKGIVPLKERLADMRARYDHADDEHTRALDAATERIEQALFEGLSLRSEDITDVSVAPVMEGLKSFEISGV